MRCADASGMEGKMYYSTCLFLTFDYYNISVLDVVQHTAITTCYIAITTYSMILIGPWSLIQNTPNPVI